MLHVFYMWPMQKTCKLQRTFNKNLKLWTHAFLILWRGAQALTFPYTISALQPLPHINNRGFWHITCAVCFSWIHHWRDGVVQTLLSKDTAVLAETGDSWFNCQKLKLPEGCGWAWLLTICSLQCKIRLWTINLQAVYFHSHWQNVAFVLKLHFN
jgi:hypothetical protein